MVGRSIILVLCLIALSAWSSASAEIALPGGFFEQVGEGAQGSWRSFGSSAGILVFPDGFALRSRDRWSRFRWDASMGLGTLDAEELLDSSSYRLMGPSAMRTKRHARRLRASREDGRLSVVYYFGSRGLEFDIEAPPNAILPELRLESLDKDLSLTTGGRVEAEGEELTLQPVAYSVGEQGARTMVSVQYRLESSRSLRFEVGSYRRSETLLIDPVVTYASYFAGADVGDPVAIRELDDGSILLVGNTKNYELPEGISLTGLALWRNPYFTGPGGCFIARLSTSENRLLYASYLNGTRCTSFDLDRAGRIVVAGVTTTISSLSTPDAQYRTGLRSVEGFLARIAEDGRELQHSTYLRVALDLQEVFVRAGAGDSVYLGFNCIAFRDCADAQISGGFQETPARALVMRYDFSAGRFTAKSYLRSATLGGIDVAPSGLVYVYGGGAGADFPTKHPIQSVPPVTGRGGFVVAFSPDLKNLEFSTYIGGTPHFTHVVGMSANPDGSIWIAGSTRGPSIPNLEPQNPIGEIDISPFAMLLQPGEGTWRRAFYPGVISYPGGFSSQYLEPTGALALLDGRFCVALHGAFFAATPGGAAVGPRNGGQLLGCVDESATKFETLTPVGWSTGFDETVLAPASDGGVWSLELEKIGKFGVAVPHELKGAALKPQPSGERFDTENLVFRHIDMRTPTPVLTSSQPLNLSALRGNKITEIQIHGRNFALGMQLEFDGLRIPLEVTSPFEASVEYESAPASPFGQSFDIRPGQFEGRLVIPTEPEAVVSEPFSVTVGRLTPTGQPFLPVLGSSIIGLAEPVYEDSQVLWDGQSIPLYENASGNGFEIRPPIELLSDGEHDVLLINPPPGGGIRRQKLVVAGNSIRLGVGGADVLTKIPGHYLTVDRSAKIAYVIFDFDRSFGNFPEFVRNAWRISSYGVPDGNEISTKTLDKAGANKVIDFEVSSDGKYIFVLDDLMRVNRLRSDTLSMDLQIQIPADGRSTSDVLMDGRRRLKALSDEPESFAVSTLAGRVVIYDGNRARPYSTADFPTPFARELEPLLASSRYIYARERQDPATAGGYVNPCIVRYPVDALGVAQPDTICDIQNDWGRYPEMKRFGEILALQDEREAVDIATFYGGSTLDVTTGLVAGLHTSHFTAEDRQVVFRADFFDLETGAPVGHYPVIPGRAAGVLGNMLSLTIVGEEALVYIERRKLVEVPWVRIVPNWRTLSEWYDAPRSSISRESRRFEGSIRGSRGRDVGPPRRTN